ncbi:MAG: flavin-containing monooxygenase [Acidimicrobiia bacterium]
MGDTDITRNLAVDVPVDRDFIRRAVEAAEPNALRTALYQATGDKELLQFEQAIELMDKGHLSRHSKLTIAEKDRPALYEKATTWLFENQTTFAEAAPSDGELRSLIELAMGRAISDEQFPELKSEASFDDYPLFLAEWSGGVRPDLPPDFKVAVIGCGHSGVAMAVQLKNLGIPFEVYERRPEMGGVWSINRYPDIRVDTMSANFQHGFVKRYPWTEYFATGPEVRKYITDIALDFGVHDRIHFAHDVKTARFDEATSRWELEIAHGGETIRTSVNFVISATGLFSNPKNLDIPGLDSFTGPVVHTTAWPDDLSVKGKRVAVIGNGSSGVQLLSRIAEEASEVYAYVRTPQWVTPQIYYGDPITPEFRWLLDHMPYYWNWDRFAWLSPSGESAGALFVPDPEWQANGGIFSKMSDELRDRLTTYIKTQTGNRPDLYERLIPKYPPWARRMIVDNNWYKTLTDDHVELVTDPIGRVETDAVVTADGKRREIDIVVAASGFDVTKYLYPIDVRGRAGVTIEERWERDGVGPRAFWSITVPEFPNLFIMYGPNSQGGAGGSLSSQLALWANHISCLIIGTIERGGHEIEVRLDAFEDHNTDLDARTSRMIWLDEDSRDRNYYVSHGRVQSMNAWAPTEHWAAMTDPNLDRDYLVK